MIVPKPGGSAHAGHAGHDRHGASHEPREVVLEAGGLLRGSSAPALDTFLKRQPGMHRAAGGQ